jgi:hypothetical protein
MQKLCYQNRPRAHFRLQAGTGAGACAISTSVSGEGRLEMLWYLHKQSISADYHRYGNLSIRADEKRAEVS